MQSHDARSVTREAGLTLVGFVVLALIFFWPAGAADRLRGGGDVAVQYLPTLLRSFGPASGAVAGCWDATAATGLPESHLPVGHYYPPTILLFSLFGPARALGLSLVLHAAWAGLGAYLLARMAQRSRAAAWLAGITYAFGGFLVFHHGHVVMHHAACWVPWVLAALEGFRRTGSPVLVCLAGTLLALHGLTGHLQTILYAGALWLTFLAWFLAVGPGPALSRWRFGAGTLGACLLGGAGCLPQVLPLVEVASWSRYGTVVREFCWEGHFKLGFLAGFLGPHVLGGREGVPFVPDHWGLTEHGLYLGLLPLSAALLVLAGWRRGQPQASPPAGPSPSFWACVLVLNLLLMLSRAAGVNRLTAHIPIYNYFHLPARHACFAGLALALLAGHGLDRLREANRRWRLLGRVGLLLVGVGLLGWLAVARTKNWTCPPLSYPGFTEPILLGALSLAVLALVTAALTRGRAWLVCLVPLLAFAELAWQIGGHDRAPAPAGALVDAEQFPEAVRWLRAHAGGTVPRALVTPQWWTLQGEPMVVPKTFLSAWGISAVSGYTQSLPASLAELLHLDFWGTADAPAALAEERGLSAVACHYIVHQGPLPLIAPGMGCVVEEASGEGNFLAEVYGAPRAGVGLRFGTFRFDLDRYQVADLRLHYVDGSPVPLDRIRLWKLAGGFAQQSRDLTPDEVTRRLYAGLTPMCELRARLGEGVAVSENVCARDLATLVRQTRPCATELEAARAIREPGAPVREVACVVGAAAAAQYAGGEVDRLEQARNVVRCRTRTAGPGFLVVAVTRCRGWCATVDGHEVPIRAVDGPLMGIEVPGGTHAVELRFRPVLFQAGLAVALLVLGGAWGAVLLRRLLRGTSSAVQAREGSAGVRKAA
jgi:hypothetical protein